MNEYFPPEAEQPNQYGIKQSCPTSVMRGENSYVCRLSIVDHASNVKTVALDPNRMAIGIHRFKRLPGDDASH
ncbi:hypothetical protein CBM2634_U270002 [Cupriavidus taiwanensis]|uniref:Uncharacterized protein n=1 Tax=Cupriavidus taiwanensis TaxID=164546 RepID=A0A375JC92_9BURK|nr:hypothetical protein CBM2634_U270002 [Cupriavidus taiwanensis]